MKPLVHAKNSVRKFGGKIEDYIFIHEWFDQTKAHVADNRHRLFLHNSFGIHLCAAQLGQLVKTEEGYSRLPYIVNSDGKMVMIRDIGEQHVLEDFAGKIPSLEECLQLMADSDPTRKSLPPSLPKNYILVD